MIAVASIMLIVGCCTQDSFDSWLTLSLTAHDGSISGDQEVFCLGRLYGSVNFNGALVNLVGFMHESTRVVITSVVERIIDSTNLSSI